MCPAGPSRAGLGEVFHESRLALTDRPWRPLALVLGRPIEVEVIWSAATMVTVKVGEGHHIVVVAVSRLEVGLQQRREITALVALIG